MSKRPPPPRRYRFLPSPIAIFLVGFAVALVATWGRSNGALWASVEFGVVGIVLMGIGAYLGIDPLRGVTETSDSAAGDNKDTEDGPK